MSAAVPRVIALFGSILFFRLLFWFLPIGDVLAGIAAVTFALVGYPIGWVAGHFVSRDGNVDTGVFRAVAWGNLLSWILPVAGTALSAITWQFHRHSNGSEGFYARLSCTGCVLAFASAGVGGGLVHHQRAVAEPLPYVSTDRYRARSGTEEAERDLAAGNGTMLYAFVSRYDPPLVVAPGLAGCDPANADARPAGPLFAPIPEANLDERVAHSNDARARAETARRFAADYNRRMFLARSREIVRKWCPSARLAT